MSVASRTAAFVGSRVFAAPRPLIAFSFAMPSFNGQVLCIEPDSEGGAYFGGMFTEVVCNVTGAVYATGYAYLVHCLPSGEVDAGFSAGANAIVRSIVYGSTGLYIAGNFGFVGGVARSRVARLRPHGSATPGAADAWRPDAGGTVYGLHLEESAGFLYVVGDFASVGGASADFALTTRNNAARVSVGAAATLSAWNPNANARIHHVTVQGSFVYLGGFFTKLNGGISTRNYLARTTLDEAISIDTWHPNLNGACYSMAFSGSNVFFAGSFSLVGGVVRLRAAAVTTANPAVLLAWRPDLGSDGYAISVLRDSSNVAIGGRFDSVGGASSDFESVASPGIIIVTPDAPCAVVRADYGLTDATDVVVQAIEPLVLDGSKFAVGGQLDNVTSRFFSKGHNAAVLER